MGKVVAQAIMSLDGYVAKQNNTIGRLFDWLQNGEIEIPTPAGDFAVVTHRLGRRTPRGTVHLRDRRCSGRSRPRTDARWRPRRRGHRSPTSCSQWCADHRLAMERSISATSLLAWHGGGVRSSSTPRTEPVGLVASLRCTALRAVRLRWLP